MKVTHITDIDKFFEVIDSCKGRVELVTGDSLTSAKREEGRHVSFSSEVKEELSRNACATS
mgnify:CR=1 FL=1